jgi:lysozyme family protein
MAEFGIAYPLTSKHEGGYVNDPTDRGGETYAGITRKNYPTWAGWATIDQQPRKKNEIIPSLADEVKEFYRVMYWNKQSLSGLKSQKVANAIYDWNINSGAIAIKAIQRLINVADDGYIGGDTLKAINAAGDGVLSKYIEERIAFYKRIVEKDPSQTKFLKGWVNRAKSFA